ncbi:rRNA maturation RNase YbeY [candidate division WWE3 bacterium]|jgi:probable rRNA maturation factor|uniref:Endoribonuclease YbeY n=1 Tax=candidate division WWE3 bacterium TaxID=2053526 RepID=A0A3A4ZG03_UNCKA|nr:MAG: rRNA maturation RNase YbeY [candidate division WWE3 bacterium]
MKKVFEKSFRDVEISVTLTTDKEIRKLNKKFRSKDYPTDVLSFNIEEKKEDGGLYLGDVIVNVQQAKRQAKEFGNSLEQEIAALVEHGVLHLLGVHHDGDDH